MTRTSFSKRVTDCQPTRIDLLEQFPQATRLARPSSLLAIDIVHCRVPNTTL